MSTSADIQLALEDLLAQLWHTRRTGDLGRLAHVSFSEVQRWAHTAAHSLLVSRARDLLARCPYEDREDFVWAIDRLIAEVEFAHSQLVVSPPTH